MEKGDGVANDEDDGAVRTIVSQDQVTVILCTEEFFLSTQEVNRRSTEHVERSQLGFIPPSWSFVR